MSRICEIFALLNIADCPTKIDLCDDPAVWDLCQDIGGQKDCDLRFVDYFQRQSCALEITEVQVDFATVTVITDGSTKTIFYKFLAANGTVVQDWGLSNEFIAEEIGQYLVQVQDIFGCADSTFFEVTEISSTPAYTHFRLYATSNNGDTSWTGTTELELCDTIGGASIAVGAGGTVTANAFNASYPPVRAFDGSRLSDSSTGWLTAATFPVWIQYEFPTPREVLEWGLGVYPTATTRVPRSFRQVILQGSNDGINYDDLDNREITDWANTIDDFRRFIITY